MHWNIHCMRLVAELQKVFVDLTVYEIVWFLDNDWMKFGSTYLIPLQL